MIRTVYIEDSKTPIYRRIAYALGAQLARRGMEVLVVKPPGFNSSTFHEFLSHQDAAVYISNGGASNVIQSKLPGKDEYFFEIFPGKLIFIHQDTILDGSSLLDNFSKLQAWRRVAERSAHLCIEPSNVADLTAIGIPNSQVVPHATEIEPTEPCTQYFQYDTVFVGHVVPSLYKPIADSARIQRLIEEAMRIKCADLSSPLFELIDSYSKCALEGIGGDADRAILQVAYSQWIRGQIKNQSLPLRGWVFENAALHSLTIFGGDPAYLHGVERSQKIQRTGVTYQAPTHDPQQTHQIFNKSKVNINITSLQFDYAVVNRFHDVIMSGGLCLTEAFPGLRALTSAHEDVSFRTLDELQDRIDYFSRPENLRQRSLLIKSIQKEIACNSGYPLLVEAIFKSLNTL